MCAGLFALDGCVPGCDSNWLGDGECDETCNMYECEYDHLDCFHGAPSAPAGGLGACRGRHRQPVTAACTDWGECYEETDGSDYRGSVSETKGGITCQLWSHLPDHA